MNLLLGLASLVLAAQPAVPPPPAKYQATLRYRILAPRDQYVFLYDDMIAALEKLGFEFQPPLDEHPPTDRMDPRKNELRGLVRSDKVAQLRAVPNIAGLLLVPEEMKLPEDPAQAVRLRLELTSGLPADRQRELAIQAKLLLEMFGFQEAPGYDHHGDTGRPYTRLQGAMPTGQLDVLVKDLRTQPGGWFAPRIPSPTLPFPLQQVNPIRYAVVSTDAAPIQDVAVPAPRTPEFLDKIGPGLWEMVNVKEEDKVNVDQLVRVQVLFAGQPSAAAMQQLLQQAALGTFVEGLLGTTASAQVRLGDVKAIAALLEVIRVRFAPPAQDGVDPKLPADFEPDKALEKSGLKALHDRGHRGKGVRLAILDTDFRGWDKLVQAKELPAKTRLVDLTQERTRDFKPLPVQGAGLGRGTQLARAAALAAPEADLVLIRLPETDPYLIDEFARYLRGGLTSPTLVRRLNELSLESELLALDGARLAKERNAILDDFRDETEMFFDYGFLGPVYAWIFSERQWHRQRQAHHQARERDYADRERRYWKLLEEVRGLPGIDVVVSPFTWNDSYPLGGVSPLSRSLDAQPHSPLWFVPAGNTAGQSWLGRFRDVDQNGVMEFQVTTAKLPPGRWSSELNFLTWQPHAGKSTPELPEKARLRIALHGREPHDPDYYLRPGEMDYYRQPLTGLRLTLLRQRDPEAKMVAADSFDVVARSPALPTRLDHQPTGTVYEQVLEWTVAAAGRYALQIELAPASRLILDREALRFIRLEGLAPTGTRPLEAPTLPAVEKTWELFPRLSVAGIDQGADETSGQGRPLLADFATDAGSVGLPADARCVISVGAADLTGKRPAYSAAGTPPFIGLAKRPTVYASDALRSGEGPAWGTSLSTAFAAGGAAAVLSSGTTPGELVESLSKVGEGLFPGSMGRVGRTK